MIQLLLPRGSAVWCTANPLGLAYRRLESWSRSVSIPETDFDKSCAMKIGLTLYGLLLRASLHFSLFDVFFFARTSLTRKWEPTSQLLSIDSCLNIHLKIAVNDKPIFDSKEFNFWQNKNTKVFHLPLASWSSCVFLKLSASCNSYSVNINRY